MVKNEISIINGSEEHRDAIWEKVLEGAKEMGLSNENLKEQSKTDIVPGEYSLAVRNDGKVMGIVRVRGDRTVSYFEKSGDHIKRERGVLVDRLYVPRSNRGKGVYRALRRHIRDKIKEKNASRVLAVAQQKNIARHLGKIGFKKLGISLKESHPKEGKGSLRPGEESTKDIIRQEHLMRPLYQLRRKKR